MGREGENQMDKQAYLAQIDRVIAAGPYKADWGSLSRHATPGWYQDAKLGIFIHWGIYSVPGYHNEWYSREMYDPKTPSYRYHVAHYGKPDQFGYKDFIPMFKGEKFDPAAWAKLSRSFFADSSYMLSFSVLCSCVCSRLISPSVSSWHKQDNTLMHQSPGHIQRRTPYNF